MGWRAMNEFDFMAKLNASKAARSGGMAAIIKTALDGCQAVEEASVELDKQGVDYVATLRRGAQVFIDMKSREAGAAKYWSDGPELTLETWSVLPVNGSLGKVGWTLDEQKITDCILYVFEPSDTDAIYFLPFQHLRMAFRRNFIAWTQAYKVARQSSGDWQSECVFVPAAKVLSAINETYKATYSD